MLRDLQTNYGKVAEAGFTAAVAMVKGMVVQKDYAAKEAILPTNSSNLFFVTKAMIPTGLLTVQGELSDYTADFENIAADEAVILEAPVVGEVYGTDQVVTAGLTDGNYLMADTDGKLIAAASATSIFKYVGAYVDGTHTLSRVVVIEPHIVA